MSKVREWFYHKRYCGQSYFKKYPGFTAYLDREVPKSIFYPEGANIEIAYLCELNSLYRRTCLRQASSSIKSKKGGKLECYAIF